jgi:60 kDa SS-A/Ro ribonucleoprotein
MAKLNIMKLSNLIPSPRTHEGGPARHISPELQLRRSVLACLLWESQFYEEGVEIAGRIRELVPKVAPEQVAALAVEARVNMKLRHAPLMLVREMARHATYRKLVAEMLERVIQRADELAEFMAIYWKEGRVPLSGQVKKGLAAAFGKFDEYQLAKYNRDGPIKLRDVLFLTHAKPVDRAQAELWKRLAEGTLATPDTWEVALSAGGDKRTHWERLLSERKLGALALLRNLRNMEQAKVDEQLIFTALKEMKTDRVLPFRFIAAARYAPQWEEALERAMFSCVAGQPKMQGKTVLLVDVSGSMDARLSGKSDMTRADAGYGLAILLREVCEKVEIFSFSDHTKRIAPRRGFALRDALHGSQPHSGTELGNAVKEVQGRYDRLIVITDEQAADAVPAPTATGYVINVASYKNGVGYGRWMHIDGWSEAVIDYIRAFESYDWAN